MRAPDVSLGRVLAVLVLKPVEQGCGGVAQRFMARSTARTHRKMRIDRRARVGGDFSASREEHIGVR